MSQVGHHVTDAVDGILNGKRFLIHDGDRSSLRSFRAFWRVWASSALNYHHDHRT